jgi:hypothetical protein
MTISVFVGADDATGQAGFCIFDVEESGCLHHQGSEYGSEFILRSTGFPAWTGTGTTVGVDRRTFGNSALRTHAPRARAVREIGGIPCLSRSRRSVRILC